MPASTLPATRTSRHELGLFNPANRAKTKTSKPRTARRAATPSGKRSPLSVMEKAEHVSQLVLADLSEIHDMEASDEFEKFDASDSDADADAVVFASMDEGGGEVKDPFDVEFECDEIDVNSFYRQRGSMKYLQAIGNCPLLTAEQEITLANMIKTGDQQAMELLIRSNLKLVVAIVKRHLRPGGMEFDDLVQDGNMGVMRAAIKFQPELGLRFTTYAVPWVIQKVMRACKTKHHLIYLPPHVTERVDHAKRALNEAIKSGAENVTLDALRAQLEVVLCKATGSKPARPIERVAHAKRVLDNAIKNGADDAAVDVLRTQLEVAVGNAAGCHASSASAAHLLRQGQGIVSLDAKAGGGDADNDNSLTIGEMLVDSGQDPERHAEIAETLGILQEALNIFDTEKERVIFAQRSGLNADIEVCHLQDISTHRVCELTQEEVLGNYKKLLPRFVKEVKKIADGAHPLAISLAQVDHARIIECIGILSKAMDIFTNKKERIVFLQQWGLNNTVATAPLGIMENVGVQSKAILNFVNPEDRIAYDKQMEVKGIFASFRMKADSAHETCQVTHAEARKIYKDLLPRFVQEVTTIADASHSLAISLAEADHAEIVEAFGILCKALRIFAKKPKPEKTAAQWARINAKKQKDSPNDLKKDLNKDLTIFVQQSGLNNTLEMFYLHHMKIVGTDESPCITRERVRQIYNGLLRRYLKEVHRISGGLHNLAFPVDDCIFGSIEESERVKLIADSELAKRTAEETNQTRELHLHLVQAASCRPDTPMQDQQAA